MTLTEFLLERIAEDERAARKLAEVDRRPVLSLASTVNHPERLLLEIEAKRRIIQREVDSHTRITYRRQMVLQDLALPYADHDDYDESWLV